MSLKVSDAICGKRICESASAVARERAVGARSAITQRTLMVYLLAHSALHDVSVPPEEMYFAQPHLYLSWWAVFVVTPSAHTSHAAFAAAFG